METSLKIREQRPLTKLTISVLSFLLMVAFLLPSSGLATSYYVSNNGSDAYNGTSASKAWQTIAHVNARNFKPGDFILFQAGGIWTDAPLTPIASGTSGSPITFGSYGTGANASISGAGANQNALVVYQLSYLTFQNITFTAGSLSTDGTVVVGNSHNIVFKKVEVSNGAGYGISVWGSSSVNINNCTVHNNGQTGIMSSHGTNTSKTPSYIQSSSIQYNGYHGIEIIDNYWIIQANLIGFNGNPTVLCVGIEIWGDSTSWAQNNIVRYNDVYDTISLTPDGEGVLTDTNSQKNSIYYNIATGNQSSGFGDNSGQTGNVFYNNTAYWNLQNPVTSRGEFSVSSSGTFPVVKNNLFYATQENGYAFFLDTSGGNGATLQNNDFYAPNVTGWYSWVGTLGSSLSTFNTLTGVSANLNANPLFASQSTGDLTLQAGSPVIWKGVNVGLTQDYAANKVHNPPTMGAYEYE